ncbi:ATP-binding protein [Mucilaginibacter aquatilis]|uniref:histidine kinase n=1 Tax=Mucilaginibacter aquatilis TaxID=1517760 RepID=A0A6I4IAU2_9SPHI|nr:ATP-binding protein [Mucilaginibacter aquatilis]MVN90579.1 PAS domain S-box protein [Mucilaginibacter aquatilis]
MINTLPSLNSEMLLHVLSLSKDATAIYSGSELVIAFANNAMLEFWGKDSSIIGQSLIDAVPELQGQPFFAYLQGVFETGISKVGISPAETLRNGMLQTRYYEYEYKAVKNAAGVTYCILHTAADVTNNVLGQEAIERSREQEEALNRETSLNEELAAANEQLVSTNDELQKAQQQLNELNAELERRVSGRTRELQESESRFRAMAEGSGIMIAVEDDTSQITFLSKAWADFTGQNQATLAANGWTDFIHPDDKQKYRELYLAAFNKCEPFTGELRLRGVNDHYYWILSKGNPLFRPDGSFAGYIITCVDITEQKELEQRKDDFISIASHELKTPLTSLKASLQLMDKIKHNPTNAMMPKLIMQSRKSIQRVSTLVDDLLNVRRLQQGEMQLNKTYFILSQLLNACANPIAITGSHRISITGDLELEILADEHRIDQVVTNFINNAAKYAPDCGLISMHIEQVDGVVKVSVSDTGPGIPKSKIQHLFDRYYRVDASGFQVSGLGLGLYISAEIIKRHGGEIGADSELGQGSTFWFTLPID